MSLKGNGYETQQEVEFRLLNTVVMYDGSPVYISRVTVPEEDDKKEIARVFFYELPFIGLGGGKEQRKYLSSKNFDLAPFKMGYFNHNGSAFHVSRAPVRQNRQGLDKATTVLTDIRGKAAGGIDFNGMIRSSGFFDMVKGKYPDFKDIGHMLDEKDTSSVAASRSFAFHIDHDLEALLLMHRGIKCGIALKGEKHMRLPPKFHFLRQEAEECRIPLA